MTTSSSCSTPSSSAAGSSTTPGFSEIRRQGNFYNQAIVDILVKQYGTVASSIW